MNKPEKAGNCPAGINLKKGYTYSWCSCGLSFNQPFCDGAHMGTKFKPYVFKAEENSLHFICMCKQTKNRPYCDDSHQEK